MRSGSPGAKPRCGAHNDEIRRKRAASVMLDICIPLSGGGVSCQFFIWFVALLIALTAGSGGCAGLIILILGPDLICMLGCVAIFIFLLAFVVLICRLPNAQCL